MLKAAALLYPMMGLLLCSVVALRAEDDPVPAFAGEPPVVSLELMGRGLVPTARVVVFASPRGTRTILSRTWTYQVQPQSLSDGTMAPHNDIAVAITLPPERIFHTASPDTTFVILPGRTWGQDHALDLRMARLAAGMVKIRLLIGEASSPWVNYRLPDVPVDLPLAVVGSDAHKLDREHLERLAKTSSATIIRGRFTSGDHPWTRIFTLDAKDPMAPLLPKLLIDGKSTNMVADDLLVHCAISGVSPGGAVEDGATFLGVELE